MRVQERERNLSFTDRTPIRHRVFSLPVIASEAKQSQADLTLPDWNQRLLRFARNDTEDSARRDNPVGSQARAATKKFRWDE
jgi:hypothetical protein